MKPDKTQSVVKRYELLKAKKAPWNNIYQKVGEFIRIRKQDFDNRKSTDGKFLTEALFDTTAVFANRTSSAALLGMLWPSGERSVRIVPPDDMKGNVKDYFEWVTKKMSYYMGLSEAGLNIILDEYMQDNLSFGTGGVAVYDEKESYDIPIKFGLWDVVHMCIAENKYGFVDTIYGEFEFPVLEAEAMYGLENLPDKAKEQIKEGKYDEKLTVLIAFEPRTERDKQKAGNKDMPYASYHIALDTKKLLKESGFPELPIIVARHSKSSGEDYGRCPGIESYPDVLLANSQAEAIIRAAEKQLDPPLGVLDDGSLGTGTIDTSAGALNVLSFNGRVPQSTPIFPIFTVAEMRSMQEQLVATQQKIAQHYYIDRLMDLNNDTRMTLGEAQIRDRIRGESLSSVLNRQMTELFSPLVKRVFNILYRRGFLGVDPDNVELAKKLQANGVEVREIPAEVLERQATGADVYEIQYISPAARILEKEKVTSVMTVIESALALMQIDQNVRHKLKAGRALEVLSELTGGDGSILASDAEVEKAVKQEQAMQQKMLQTEQMEGEARALRDTAQARSMARTN